MRNDRLISLNAAIDAVHNYWIAEGHKLPRKTVGDYEVLDGDYKTPLRHNKKICEAIESLPSACHLLEDGTLIVKVPNLSAVHRVIVDEENSQYCKTFYQDGDT